MPRPSSLRGKQFWTYSFYGKRLVVFPDCNNYNFPNEGLFKSLTGGDAVPMEAKNQNAFSATPTSMFMFVSNEAPNITGQNSNVRRAIYGYVSPITGKTLPQHVIDSALMSEGPWFIGECLNLYEEVCPDFGDIPTERAGIDEVISSNEESFEETFKMYFKPAPKGAVLASKLVEVKNLSKMNRFEYRSFITYLKRQYGVYPRRSDDGKSRIYVGLTHISASDSIHNIVQKETDQLE